MGMTRLVRGALASPFQYPPVSGSSSQSPEVARGRNGWFVNTIARADTSYSTPQWSPDGKHLAYVTDESGWRSVWVGGPHGERGARLETGEGEIGLPDWLPGRYGYRWSDDGAAIYAVRSRKSRDTLLRVAWPAGTVEEIASEATRCSCRLLRA